MEVGLPEDALPDDEIEGFVRNTGGVAICQGSPLSISKTLYSMKQDAFGEEGVIGVSNSRRI